MRILQEQGKRVLIAALQDFFSYSAEARTHRFSWKDPTTPAIPGEQYNWVYIGDRAPEQMRQLPALVVKSDTSREQRLAFNNKVGGIIDSKTGDTLIRYTGKFQATYSIIIASKTTMDRDRLADLVSLCILVFRIAQIQAYGVILVPNSMVIGPDDFFMYDETTPVERTRVTFGVELEWFEDTHPIDQTLLKTLNIPPLSEIID